MDRFAPLREHVAKLPVERIYRTIYDEDLNVVVEGFEPLALETLADFRRADFSGKSVVDMGCNFGFFSFEARRLGARDVLGVDFDPAALEGARILRSIFGLDAVDFMPLDFHERPSPLQGRLFDMVMLVEFIGKGYTRSGRILELLEYVEQFTEKELLLTVRREYDIRADLGMEEDAFLALYPDAPVSQGVFHIMKYVLDFYAPRWQVEIITPPNKGHEKLRKFLRFYK